MALEDLGFVSVPAIVTICYLIGTIFKSFIQTEAVDKWIPLICSGMGCILGIMAFYLAPDLIPAENMFTAAAIGIVSGFSATGINQVYKQLTPVTTSTIDKELYPEEDEEDIK